LAGHKTAPRPVSLGAHYALIEPDSYFVLRSYDTIVARDCQIAPELGQSYQAQAEHARFEPGRPLYPLSGRQNRDKSLIPAPRPVQSRMGSWKRCTWAYSLPNVSAISPEVKP
jgi:hypothetical protein